MAQGGFASTQSVTTLARLMRQQQQQMTSMGLAQDGALATSRTHLAVGAVAGIAIALGGSQDVVVTWPGSGFTTADYCVEIVPTGILGKGSCSVVAQDESTVTVRITAAVLIAVGTQFMVLGTTNRP
jgi:phosphate/sulfate permease